MKLAVVGGRDFNDWKLMQDKLAPLIVEARAATIGDSFMTIVSGGAKGADSCAEYIAKLYGLKTIIFKPDWQQHGKQAGYLRNIQIVDECDKLIAFWDGKSRGTFHSISLAYKQKKLFKIVHY